MTDKTDSKLSEEISVISSVLEDKSVTDSDEFSDNELILIDSKKTNFNIVSVSKSYENYISKKKKTLPYINKYEKAKIFGIRAQQLANGMQPMVPIHDKINIREIVTAEYKQKKLPLILRRYLPDSSYEDWRVSDFVNI